ncbi:hypothetical protein CLOSTASPAR_02242 [[Clostridium] asparagiforme DSM 15981]|uniref:Uncharacterized protein n=1 Tax=[Clostridium] asparagiforme DSM 15981 TaxID=518636 RepID=C0CZ15_9FIRM|nr:hypothetical protein CLOSTASPAR_02242 [[Clostridium] asparagiforme DSM 15981]
MSHDFKNLGFIWGIRAFEPLGAQRSTGFSTLSTLSTEGCVHNYPLFSFFGGCVMMMTRLTANIPRGARRIHGTLF